MHVEERHRNEGHGIGAEAIEARHRSRGRGEVALEERHLLRAARRPARVQEERNVVGTRLVERGLGVGADERRRTII